VLVRFVFADSLIRNLQSDVAPTRFSFLFRQSEFLRDHPEKRVQSVEVWRNVSGYVLAPVTLTADQLASLTLKCSQKRQGGEHKTNRGGARALEAANVERLMMREEAKQLKQLTTHVSKGGASSLSSLSPLSSLSSSSSSSSVRRPAPELKLPRLDGSLSSS